MHNCFMEYEVPELETKTQTILILTPKNNSEK